MKKLDKLLMQVDKPARYIGMELGSVYKDLDDVSVSMAFSYPDVYEIAMSYSGLEIIYGLINEREDFLCERVFAPWPDMEEAMREEGLELFTLESKSLVKDFDFFGFTFQYELSYSNMVNLMDLAGLSPWAKERKEEDPIIIGGGPSTYNPEPMAEFFDIFLIGEGEELILEVFDLYKKIKTGGRSKLDFLDQASSTIEGVYVPRFHQEIYDGQKLVGRKTDEGHPPIVKKRYIMDMDKAYSNPRPLVPNIKSLHDRVVEGVFRACTQGCRFCQAGMIYRPIREKSPETVMPHLNTKLKATGHNEISLSSLSTCDYKYLDQVIDMFMEDHEGENITIGLPSLRLDSKGLEVLEKIHGGRKTSMTFAPEAGSQRLRDVINKNITRDDIKESISYCFANGYTGIKFYFMIGLPTETYEDLDGIVDLAYMVKDMFYAQDKEDMKGNLSINVSTSNFVPKPFTPFQWQGQDGLDSLEDKAQYLKNKLRDNKISYSYHDAKTSRLEAALAKGDRRLSQVIYRAWENGASFDSWQEHFSYEIWEAAFDEAGIDMDYYVIRPMDFDECLPWDFISIGVTKDFLIREAKKAQEEKKTPDCRQNCHGCGVNRDYPGEYCPCI